MPYAETSTRKDSVEEEDLLQRSTKRSKESHDPPDLGKGDLGQLAGAQMVGRSHIVIPLRELAGRDKACKRKKMKKGTRQMTTWLKKAMGCRGSGWE